MKPTEPSITLSDLAHLTEEKISLPAELIRANKKLAQQIEHRSKRAAELVIANTELAYQNREKEKRAAELVIANTELAYQNKEKEKRAAELVVANTELAFQNQEKEKRAAELIIANSELAFQNKEKEKRATELLIANIELTYQNNEKEQRSAELAIANFELDFQNKEKEKRASELLIANKALESFTYISTHHLQEPLRKIQLFSNRILMEEHQNLSEKGQHYFKRSEYAAAHLQTLINDLLTYSRTNSYERKFVDTNLDIIAQEVIEDLKNEIEEKQAIIQISNLGNANIIPVQFKQLLKNL
ncbi:MAG: histidine kinase dimerization/phospho-acceptor domain-containing protein, partial [Flavobacterium sp.]